MRAPAFVALGLVVVFVGCKSSDTTPDAGIMSDEVGVAPDAFVVIPTPDAQIPRRDIGITIHHDAGVPPTCVTTCDCPQGLACLNGRCGTAGVGSVWCCDNPGCPFGQTCLDTREQPSTCPAPPDAGPDAGPRDIGAGAIGAPCMGDMDCDQTQGFSCWEQTEIQFLWDGYCTVENCSPGCPSNSICITINGTPARMGCMQTCLQDNDCRSDAYCFLIPNSTIRICLPDCRDDLLDCAPRDGTSYCSRTSGQCEMTPMQTVGAKVGDPCVDNTACGPGQICMSQVAWGFPGGMCTQVCSGLAEASPCGTGETCQMVAGIGLCFADCVANACPNRASSICAVLDMTWPSPGCIPQ